MKVNCKDCNKDITDIVYEKGEPVITWQPADQPFMILVPLCRECIQKRIEEIIDDEKE